MVAMHDRERALETLQTIEHLLDTKAVPEHKIIGGVRASENRYNWHNGVSPELKADLDYLHGINALIQQNGTYRRDNLTGYWLGRR